MKKLPKWILFIIILCGIEILGRVTSYVFQVAGIYLQIDNPFIIITMILMVWVVMLLAARKLKPKHSTIARLLVIAVVLQVSASIVIAIAAIAGFLG